MEESLREACLKEMGIEIWRQRAALPIGVGQIPEQAVEVVLGIATAPPDLCILFELEVDEAGALQLLGDLCRALGGDAAKLALATAPGSVDPGDLVDGDARRVLLLGDRAAALRSGALGQREGVHCCATHGIREIRANPLLKRDLWNDLCALLSQGAHSG